MNNYFGHRSTSLSRTNSAQVAVACVGILGLLISVTAFLIVSSPIEDSSLQPKKAAPHVETTVEILVPKISIAPKQKLTSDLFEVQIVPASALRPGTLQNVEELENRYALIPLAANFPVPREYLSQLVPTNDIRDDIPAGMRAVTVKSEKIAGAVDWIEPGAKIDVASISTMDSQLTLTPMVSDVLVHSIGRRTAQSAGEKPDNLLTFTLITNQIDADRIQLAQQIGLLSVTLRGTEKEDSWTTRTPLTRRDIDPNIPASTTEEIKYDGKFEVNGEVFYIKGNRIVPKEASE